MVGTGNRSWPGSHPLPCPRRRNMENKVTTGPPALSAHCVGGTPGSSAAVTTWQALQPQAPAICPMTLGLPWEPEEGAQGVES